MALVQIDQNRLQNDQSYRDYLRGQGYFVGSDNGRVYAQYQGGGSSTATAPPPTSQVPLSGATPRADPVNWAQYPQGGQQQSGQSAREQDLAAQLSDVKQQLFTALSAATQAQQQEAIREYNQTLATQQQQFATTETEKQREFDIDQQNTQAAAAENQRQFNINAQTGLLDTASKLTGPADYFNFLNFAHGGQNVLQALSGTQALPTGVAPQGENHPLGLADLMQSLGISGFEPQTNAVGSSDPTRTVQAAPIGSDWQQAGAQQQASGGTSGLNVQGTTIPYGNQIDPAVWDSLGPNGQQFFLGGVSAAGYDPQEYVRQIDATRPMGTAPRTTTTAYSAPTSEYGGSTQNANSAFSF